MSHFHVCIIGGGPSGYAAAMRAHDLGKTVALIEEKTLGGAALFNGALSSKTLWELSENFKMMRTGEFGYQVFDFQLAFSSVKAEMIKAVNEKHTQLNVQVKTLQKNGDLKLFQARGRLLDKHTVLLTDNDGQESTLTADNIILATGSRPRHLPHIPIDENIIFTSDGINNLTEFPESIVILGAGVIGCEFATIFSNFERTRVHLIDKQPRILPFEDDDVAEEVAKNLESNGVIIHRQSSLEKMEVVNGKVRYYLKYDDGREESYTVDKALISVGRVPNTEHLGLQEAGVEFDSRGFIVDHDSRTNIPNIYAVGDLTADIALVNVAELEGRHAIEKAYGLCDNKVMYNNISTIMFLNPEVASVGLNETTCRQNKIAYRMASLKYGFVNRAIAMRKRHGFFKLIVSDDENMTILGMRVVGAHASSTIQAVALLVSMNKGITELAELVHAHPSMPEGIQECARMLLGNSIVKPEAFVNQIKCIRVDKTGHTEPFNRSALVVG